MAFKKGHLVSQKTKEAVWKKNKMTKQQELQILELNSNVKCYLAPSKISGVGVFALMDIAKGQRLNLFPNVRPKWHTLSMSNLNQLFPEIKELILAQWASIINGSAFLSPHDSCWMILYCNHSDDQNYDVKTDMAIRNIRKGEEVTENYREMLGWERVFPWLQKENVV